MRGLVFAAAIFLAAVSGTAIAQTLPQAPNKVEKIAVYGPGNVICWSGVQVVYSGNVLWVTIFRYEGTQDLWMEIRGANSVKHVHMGGALCEFDTVSNPID